MPLYLAARNTKACVGFIEDDELLVCVGIFLDEIVYLSGDTDTPDDWYAMAQKYRPYDGMPPLEKKINRNFWSVMYGDATSSWTSEGGGKLIA
jgi:hypothetical protein